MPRPNRNQRTQDRKTEEENLYVGGERGRQMAARVGQNRGPSYRDSPVRYEGRQTGVQPRNDPIRQVGRAISESSIGYIGRAITSAISGDNQANTGSNVRGRANVQSQTLPQVTRIPQRNSIGKPASPIRNPRIGK